MRQLWFFLQHAHREVVVVGGGTLVVSLKSFQQGGATDPSRKEPADSNNQVATAPGFPTVLASTPDAC